jgi:hypothetical protein
MFVLSSNRLLIVALFFSSMLVQSKHFPPFALPSKRYLSHNSIIRLSGGLRESGENLDSNDVEEATYVAQLQTASDLNDAGFILLQSGDFAQAEDMFQAALRQDPNHPAALCNYGRLLVRRQRVSFVNPVCALPWAHSFRRATHKPAPTSSREPLLLPHRTRPSSQITPCSSVNKK